MYEKSIELLNTAVADELSAVHQYMYFHFHCDDQGIELLSDLFKRTAIEEMLHLERLADRTLFLKGDVVMEAAECSALSSPAAPFEEPQDLGEVSAPHEEPKATPAAG